MAKTGHPRSDVSRANGSVLVAALVAVATSVPAIVSVDGSLLAEDNLVEVLVPFYLVFWPVFVLAYLAWTHRSYARMGGAELASVARREGRARVRWWHAVLGYGGAASWTAAAAIVAVALTIAIAQRDAFGDELEFVLLGLLSVASSWALMVYSFALAYMRVDADTLAGTDSKMVFQGESPAEFTDYLTLAILASTMAATISATIRTRRAWRVIRTNVVLAFVFNSVIVAMMVSLLFGGIAS